MKEYIKVILALLKQSESIKELEEKIGEKRISPKLPVPRREQKSIEASHL